VNAQLRHEKGFVKLDLKYDSDNLKVKFIKADYGQSQFELSAVQFNELIRTVNILIHNAWKVNFNHLLELFKLIHIWGVHNFIDWSIHSEEHSHIIFISLISSIVNWVTVHDKHKPVSETSIDSYNVTQKMKHRESKNVLKHILDVVNEKSEVSVSILQVSQIERPLMATEVWNEDEWLPSLIKTLKLLDSLSSYVFDIDWISVNKLVTIILEIIHFIMMTDKAQIYNILNLKLIQ